MLKNCCFITMCKAHSKVTHIKQQRYFHHLKGHGYNKNSVLYPGRLRWWKYFCCFICVTLLLALHIVIKQQFFNIYLSWKPSRSQAQLWSQVRYEYDTTLRSTILWSQVQYDYNTRLRGGYNKELTCLFLAHDAMHKRSLCHHAVSVCVSVTFVDHVKTNKHIFDIFSLSGSHPILVFPYQTGWRYFDRNPPNGGVECLWGRQKSWFWAYGFSACY